MSIILTDEIINKIIQKNNKCTYINDDYVILYKTMEVCDHDLEEYLSRIQSAHASGIHIPRVVDYKLLADGKEKTSKGIFVEERAKGTVLNIRGMVLYTTQQYDFSQIIHAYLKNVNQYVIELEKRASAPQQMYNCFLDDYVSLSKFGLRPDPNSLNYLFDSDFGFTIIDPYLSHSNDFEADKLFEFIMNAIYGVSRPCILIKSNQLEAFYDLPVELNRRLEQCSKEINQKIVNAFTYQNDNQDYIRNGLESNKMRYYTTGGNYSEEEIIARLEKTFYAAIESEKTR